VFVLDVDRVKVVIVVGTVRSKTLIKVRISLSETKIPKNQVEEKSKG
jgi:hypothetical protein